MIKKYEAFNIEVEDYEMAFDIFVTTLKKCQTRYSDSEFTFSSSYSSVAQENQGNLDPESDFKLVNDYMSRCGFTIDKVNELSSQILNFSNRIYREQASRSAGMDYYLYKVTDKEFPLQGYEWSENDDDMIIKFRYGWHNTSYGRLAIIQNFGSISKFFKIVAGMIPDLIRDLLYETFKIKISPTIISTYIVYEDSSNSSYVDNESLLKYIKTVNKIEINQNEFDNLVKNSLISNKLKCRLISEGDIIATLK